MSQKKCPNCGEWSIWTNNYEDRCEHCGEILSPVDLARQQKKELENIINERSGMFYITPQDSVIKKFFKKSGNIFYTIFMAIMTFIMWLIAALPG